MNAEDKAAVERLRKFIAWMQLPKADGSETFSTSMEDMQTLLSLIERAEKVAESMGAISRMHIHPDSVINITTLSAAKKIAESALKAWRGEP
jgi:hypothetical protein